MPLIQAREHSPCVKYGFKDKQIFPNIPNRQQKMLVVNLRQPGFCKKNHQNFFPAYTSNGKQIRAAYYLFT